MVLYHDVQSECSEIYVSTVLQIFNLPFDLRDYHDIKHWLHVTIETRPLKFANTASLSDAEIDLPAVPKTVKLTRYRYDKALVHTPDFSPH